MLVTHVDISRVGDEYQFTVSRPESENAASTPVSDSEELLSAVVEEAQYRQVVKQPLIDALHERIEAIDSTLTPVPREDVLDVGRLIDHHFIHPDLLQEVWHGEWAEEAQIVISVHEQTPTNDETVSIPWELGGLIEEDGETSCLAERVSVGRRYVSSQSTGGSRQTGEPSDEARARALIIADPVGHLEEAQDEACQLMAHLRDSGWRVDPLMGEQATHRALFNQLHNTRYRLIHLCCHIVPDGDGQAVPTSRDPDYNLHSSTIQGLSLAGSVVFINGCRSALGNVRYEPGELPKLVGGMAQAFLRAGSSGVVGTIWRTDDTDAREVAEQFYADLVRGVSLGDALRNARSVGSTDAATPAAFVLYGDPRRKIETGIEPPERPATEHWPREGMLDADAQVAFRRAAAGANEDGTRLTSVHLGVALMGEDDYPLAAWLDEAGYSVRFFRDLFEAIGIELPAADEAIESTAEAPNLSPTVQNVWSLAEDDEEQWPIDLERLTAMLVEAGGGLLGELMDALYVDLSAYPEPPDLPELSPQVHDVWENAVVSGRLNEGLISSQRLLLAILESGVGHLVDFLKARDQYETVVEELGELLHQEGPVVDEADVVPSPNTFRIMARARILAAEAGKDLVEVDDVVAAAAELEAGGFGQFLEDVAYTPGQETGGGPTSPTRPGVPQTGQDPAPKEIKVEPDSETVELLERAAACAVATGFSVVGTPHVIAAGLEFDEPLQRAVTECGYDPARLLEMLLNALNAPRAISPFSPAHIENEDQRPPLSRNVYLALTRAARGLDEGARLESSALLASVLTQTSGSVPTLLQSQGVEPHEIAMALQSGV